MARHREADWAEAKRLCRLSAEDVRMARAMGVNPRELIKNRPSASQRWKSPVGEWVRELHRKRFGHPPTQRPRPVSADVFLLDPGSDRYLGRLCDFGTCPKGKPECRVAGCGSALFLRQDEQFVFDSRSLDPARGLLLFDRARGFGPPSLPRWDDDIPF